MLVGLSGSAINLKPGDEHDFEREEAVRLVAAAYAVPVGEIEIERAVATPAGERRSKRKVK